MSTNQIFSEYFLGLSIIACAYRVHLPNFLPNLSEKVLHVNKNRALIVLMYPLGSTNPSAVGLLYRPNQTTFDNEKYSYNLNSTFSYRNSPYRDFIHRSKKTYKFFRMNSFLNEELNYPEPTASNYNPSIFADDFDCYIALFFHLCWPRFLMIISFLINLCRNYFKCESIGCITFSSSCKKILFKVKIPNVSQLSNEEEIILCSL